jgi:hypothetical protein
MHRILALKLVITILQRLIENYDRYSRRRLGVRSLGGPKGPYPPPLPLCGVGGCLLRLPNF